MRSGNGGGGSGEQGGPARGGVCYFTCERLKVEIISKIS